MIPNLISSSEDPTLKTVPYSPTSSDDQLIRLQKVIAFAGVASRRRAEQLIAEGRVTVDGKVVREQGVRVNPEIAVITVDGDRIVTSVNRIYLAFNKPLGMHSTMSDEYGRPCIGDAISRKVKKGQRIFHVGRLDADTEGLILLTNDGELAHRLMHPSYQVLKTYLVQVRGIFPQHKAHELLSGVDLEDGVVIADKVKILGSQNDQSHVLIVIHEGRKHVVRRVFDTLGYPVTGLVRTDIGGIALQDQRPGSFRALNSKEIALLYELVKL